LKRILAASAALLAYLAWRSLAWPLIHDAPLMHYIGWVIGEGGVPYRDVFDMNVPGVYLIHAALLAVAGPGDLAWRLFDLGWLAATSALLWAYARPLGAGPAAAGGVLFALYHLSGGAWRVGQRDFLLCLFLLAGAWGLARSIERGGALAPLALGGLALGIGMTVKPHAGLFWLGAAALAAWSARRARRRAAAAAACVLAAGLVAPAAVFGWLGWRGGLGPFVGVLTGWVLPFYGHLGRVSVWQAFGWYRFGRGLWALFAALAVLALLSRPPAGAGARRVIALAGAVYGALHFLVQGKGWEYHLYPLAAFLCALAPFAMPSPPGGERDRVRGAVDRGPRAREYDWPGFWRITALAVFAVTVAVLGAKGVDALEAPWIAAKARVVAAVTRDLRPLAPPGSTVQVLDVTEGGVHALLNLRLRQPTRFLYDFHFFHDTGDPRIQALRAELVAGLAAGRPAAVVVFRDTWNHPGYERLREWPELARLLDRSYALAVEGDGYRIYARRADP
jgi:hypothetical protein